MTSFEWETPQDFFDTLDAEFHFTLDVCATTETAKCKHFYSPEEDSFSQPWYGKCWMNPPYNRNIGLWLKKAYEFAQHGVTVVCLIQGRSNDTKWWHEYVMKASEIRFIKGRLQFKLNGKLGQGSNISSVVVIFRPFCQGPPKTMSINRKGEKIMEEKKKELDCQFCGKIFPINEMYSVDACSSECQEKLEAWRNWVFPCCKKPLPAHLGGVELATCSCGQSFLPSILIEYNEMRDIITDWRDIVANGKAQIIAKPGEEKFIASVIRNGNKFAR